MKRAILAVIATSALSACSTSSGVIKLSPDTYKVAATATLSGGGAAAANKAAYSDAQATCDAQGKELRVVNEQSDSQMTGASLNLTFSCVEKGSK